jgi:hypothetical protein
MTLDRDTSRRTVAKIRAAWQETPDTLLIPGHDVPMRWPVGADSPHYVRTRQAGIQSWFGDDLATTYNVDLTRVEERR